MFKSELFPTFWRHFIAFLRLSKSAAPLLDLARYSYLNPWYPTFWSSSKANPTLLPLRHVMTTSLSSVLAGFLNPYLAWKSSSLAAKAVGISGTVSENCHGRKLTGKVAGAYRECSGCRGSCRTPPVLRCS